MGKHAHETPNHYPIMVTVGDAEESETLVLRELDDWSWVIQYELDSMTDSRARTKVSGLFASMAAQFNTTGTAIAALELDGRNVAVYELEKLSNDA